MEQAGEMRDTEVMPLLYVQPSVRPWGGGGWLEGGYNADL